MSLNPRDFGALEVKVEHLQQQVSALTERVERLVSLAERGRGAWWAALTFASALSAALSYFGSSFFRH